MRLITHHVGSFLGRKKWYDRIVKPFRFILGYRKLQYLNIEVERKLKSQIAADIVILQDIHFRGKNNIPQIELFRSNLIQDIKTLTPFTQYCEPSIIPTVSKTYTVASFSKSPTKVVKMTVNSHLIETSINELSILSIHLSKKNKHRREQLRFIEGYINQNIHRKYIVVGCFNIKRLKELNSLITNCSLYKATNSPTYPANNPKLFSSLILYDNSIILSATNVIQQSISDHLPIYCDFELR